jgi:hypothetical protein
MEMSAPTSEVLAKVSLAHSYPGRRRRNPGFFLTGDLSRGLEWHPGSLYSIVEYEYKSSSSSSSARLGRHRHGHPSSLALDHDGPGTRDKRDSVCVSGSVTVTVSVTCQITTVCLRVYFKRGVVFSAFDRKRHASRVWLQMRQAYSEFI